MKAFEKAIWIKNALSDGVNTYTELVGEFEAREDVTVRLACDGNYALYLNGALVDFGQYPGYEDLQFFDELALDEFLAEGVNQLRIIAHHPGRDTSTYRNQPVGVIFEVKSGDEILLASSETTKSRLAPEYVSGDSVPLVTGQLGYSFALDLTREGSDFTDSVRVERSYELEPRPIRKLKLEEPTPSVIVRSGGFIVKLTDGTAAARMYAADLICGEDEIPLGDAPVGLEVEDADGCAFIVDLGREEAGIPALDLELPEACEVLVGWGEHLADGKVRTSVGGRNFAASLKLPKGRSRILNPLLRLGGRYIEVHVFAASVDVSYVGLLPTNYPLPEPAPCPLDEGRSREIYDVCVRTLLLCMHEHYEDCPWREQALYTMDSRNQMLCGYRVWGETEFVKASLRLMAHSIREDGLLELCSPARVSITIPSFSAVFPVQVCEYLDFSGDEKTVRELLPTILRICDAFIARIEENGLIRCFGECKYWNFYEWQDGLSGTYGAPEEKRTYDAPLCAFVVMGLTSAATLCDRVENPRGDELRAVADRLRAALQLFWSEEKRCYASFMKDGELSHYCELTNSLMLYSDSVPMNRIHATREALKGGELLPVTISHSIFKYDALLDDEDNVEWVKADIEKKWGFMLDSGATSFWETLAGERDFSNAGSLCHGWSAIPVHLYSRIANMGQISW